jgi:hypothetical protein
MLVEARRVSEINPDHSVSLTLAQKISCGHAARVPGPIADWQAKKRCSPPTSTSPASPVAKIITPLRRPRLASRSFRDRDKVVFYQRTERIIACPSQELETPVCLRLIHKQPSPHALCSVGTQPTTQTDSAVKRSHATAGATGTDRPNGSPIVSRDFR